MAKPTPAAPVEPVQGATLPWPASILFMLGGIILTILRKPLPMIQRYTKALRRTAVIMLLSGLGLSCQQTSVVNIPYDLFYFHTDHLGAVKLVTDKAAAVVWEGVYSPFGEATEVVAEVENNLRFPGQYLDRETGLHQNYFRDYDPKTGRYIESDPIGLEGGLNTYAYVYGNPVNYSDPKGLCGILTPLCAGLIIYGEEITVATIIGAEIISGVPNPVSSAASTVGYAAELAPDIAGAACKVANQRPVIIGETMARVEAAAAQIPGSKILNDMPDFKAMGLNADEVTSKMMQYNRQWILDQMRSGRQIIDIGADANRTRPSIFYQMEQNMLKNYQQLNSEFRGAVSQ